MHGHHIVPRHRGGSDDPSNIVRLTPTQHCMWHWAEFFMHGCQEDYLAARGLAGLIGKDEIMFQHRSLAGQKNRDLFWWNNGSKNTRAKECPGPEWVLGRVVSWRWFNNGVENKRAATCPPGFKPGRLTKRDTAGRFTV